MIKKVLLSAVLCLGMTCAIYASPPSKPATKLKIDDPKIQQFVNDMVKNYKFNKTDLEHLLKQVKWQQSILDSIHHPKEGLSWRPYSELFITHDRIQNGVKFWQKNRNYIDKAAKEYGVAPEIIVAILGIETKYGTRQGKYRVIDSLSTLAFGDPERSKFFTKELREYLLVIKENHLNPLAFKGSYAGAFGMPQFMPSSYRAYAVDFDHSGKKDLAHDSADAIASVANYLAKNGWQRNQPVATQAIVKGDQYKKLMYTGTDHHIQEPKHTIAYFEKHGVTPKDKVSQQDKAILFKLEIAENRYENWLGFHNLYVIMRYNPSINYAMAVYQLGELIKDQVGPAPKPSKGKKVKANKTSTSKKRAAKNAKPK